VQLAQNRFWLIVPILVLNLALVPLLPPPLTPGSAGPDIPDWLSVSEMVLRVVVIGRCAAADAPFAADTPHEAGACRLPRGTRRLRRGLGGRRLGADQCVEHQRRWVHALAWISIIVFTGIGMRSTLRFVPGYRPWMYLSVAALFSAVHTLPIAIIWAWYY
jgi:hypothetical protein